MTKKPDNKDQKPNPDEVIETVSKVEATSIEKLRDDFLALNSDCPETALLAACELLEQQSAEIIFYKTAASSGFNRGMTIQHVQKAQKS